MEPPRNMTPSEMDTMIRLYGEEPHCQICGSDGLMTMEKTTMIQTENQYNLQCIECLKRMCSQRLDGAGVPTMNTSLHTRNPWRQGNDIEGILSTRQINPWILRTVSQYCIAITQNFVYEYIYLCLVLFLKNYF